MTHKTPSHDTVMVHRENPFKGYSSPEAFARYFARVPEDLRQRVLHFREEHPLQYMKIDGVWWEYIRTGLGTQTVIFLHGLLGTCDLWWQQIAHLESSVNVLSVTYPALASLEALSRGISRIVAYESLPSPALCGSSLGGYLTQYMVQAAPFPITHAIFGNTFPPTHTFDKDNRFLRLILPLLPEKLLKRFMRKNVEQVMYPASGYNELLRAHLLETLDRLSKEDLTARYACVLERFEPPKLEQKTTQACIIESDNDPVISPPLRAQLKALYPSACVHTIKQGGHFPYVSHAEAYTAILSDFITESV